MGNSENKHLKREITFFGLSANIINTVIGAGIFVLPALVAGVLGNSSLWAYLFCGLLIILIMLCFAEIGSKITVTGGAYSYIEIVLGRYAGFIAALFFLLATMSADAAVANAITDITGSIFPFMQSEIIRVLLIILLFSFLGYINIRGVKKGIGFVKMITLAKIIPLVFILLIGVKNISLSDFISVSFPSSSELGEASLLLFFAFLGAESAVSVSGEVRNPQKTIPRAIIFSVIAVGALYVFIQIISQAILGSELSQATENTLGQVAGKIIGPAGLILLTIGAGVSMFGNLSSEILSVPRVLYAASADGLIPVKLLSKIHPKFATPYVSIIVYVALDSIIAISGGFKQLILISSAASLLIYLGVVVATIRLRYTSKKSNYPTSFKVPGGLTIPVLAILVILWFLSNLQQKEFIAVGLFAVLLTLLYLILNSKQFFGRNK